MTLGNEFSHIDIKHADTIRVTFLRMTAKQLLSDTYSENRLAQVANHLVESSFLEVLHCAVSFSLPGEDNPVGSHKPFGRVGQVGFNAHSSESIDHRIYISGIIFHYSYVHNPKRLTLNS